MLHPTRKERTPLASVCLMRRRYLDGDGSGGGVVVEVGVEVGGGGGGDFDVVFVVVGDGLGGVGGEVGGQVKICIGEMVLGVE